MGSKYLEDNAIDRMSVVRPTKAPGTISVDVVSDSILSLEPAIEAVPGTTIQEERLVKSQVS